MNSTRNYTLITGASTGIGYELAKLFAKDRHNLILVARDEGKLETAKNELSKCNVEVKILSLDLSKSEDIQGLFNYVEMNKLNVDILVNNAGIGTFGDFSEIEWVKEEALIDINIKPEVVDPDDIEMLQDLVLSAVNEALRSVDEMQASQMSKVTGGMNIPGLF